MEDGWWLVSYDNGGSWERLYEISQAGSGVLMTFESDGYYVYLEFADGEILSIPLRLRLEFEIEGMADGAVYARQGMAEFSYVVKGGEGRKVTVSAASDGRAIVDVARESDTRGTVSIYNVSGDGFVTLLASTQEGDFAMKVVPYINQEERQPVVENLWHRTTGEMNLAGRRFEGQCSIAFSGSDMVFHDGQVFGIDAQKKGDLNLDGVIGAGLADFQLVCLSNTADGCLVASVGTRADGTIPQDYEGIHNTCYYAWVNGWDKAPVKIIEFSDNSENGPANAAGYFTAQGDSRGECCIAMRSAVSYNQAFSFWHYPEGIGGVLMWSQKYSGYSSVDGNWGQWITMTTGNPDDALVICDSRGQNEGYRFVVRKGAGASIGDDVDLCGTVPEDYPEAGPGTNGYGNYSTGHGRAFRFAGRDYLAACTSGWPSAYLTVQTLDPSDEDHYLLRTQELPIPMPYPAAAFVCDPDTATGYLAFYATGMVCLYRIR